MIRQTLNLAHAHMEARLRRIPMCPLRGETVTFEGDDYTVEWRGACNSTSAFEVTVTRHATGQSVGYARILLNIRRNKEGLARIRYNLRGVPGWKSRDEASAALVALSAPRLAGILAYNPETGCEVIRLVAVREGTVAA